MSVLGGFFIAFLAIVHYDPEVGMCDGHSRFFRRIMMWTGGYISVSNTIPVDFQEIPATKRIFFFGAQHANCVFSIFPKIKSKNLYHKSSPWLSIFLRYVL